MYLTKKDLNAARRLMREGKNMTQIINYLFRRTEYKSDDALESDLRRAFERRDWALPHDAPKAKRVRKLTKAQETEMKQLVRRAERLTAHLK
jgi:hypothetical protein